MSANHKTVIDYMHGFPEEKNLRFRTMADDLSDRIDSHSLREILTEERLAGRIAVGHGGYRLSGSCRKELGDMKTATHPIRNVFGPAISAKNIPSAKGMREGSNDHLSWSSKHV